MATGTDLSFAVNVPTAVDLYDLSGEGSKFFITVNGKYGATAEEFSCNMWPHTYSTYKIETIKRETAALRDSSFVYVSTVKDVSFDMSYVTGTLNACTKFNVNQGDKSVSCLPDTAVGTGISHELSDMIFYNLYDVSGGWYSKVKVYDINKYWDRKLHYRFYVEDNVNTGNAINNGLYDLSNQSIHKNTYTQRLYLDSGSVIKTTGTNNMKYVYTPTIRNSVNGCLRFTWNIGDTSIRRKKYHIFYVVYVSDNYSTNEEVPFLYHQGYTNSSWNIGSDNTSNFSNILGSNSNSNRLSIGRYPNIRDGIHDFTALYASMNSLNGDSGYTAYPSNTNGSSLMYKTHCLYGGSNGKVTTHRRTCCMVIKFDDKPTQQSSPNSAGHYGIYTYNDTVSNPRNNPTIIYDHNKWGYNVQHTINCIKFGGFEGNPIGHAPPSVDVYEVCIIEDDVVNDEEEKIIATNLLKKWLPNLNI